MAKEKRYAIISTGGKQYRVQAGDVIDVERLEVPEGDSFLFEDVLFVTDGTKARVGAPVVEGCKVSAKLLEEVKGPKVIAYKFKRRKNYHRKVGHRQRYARVEITGVEG